MNNFEAFLVELLQNRITYDDRTVYVSRNYRFETDQLPLITLDLGAGTTTEYYYHELDVRDKLFAFDKRYNSRRKRKHSTTNTRMLVQRKNIPLHILHKIQ